MMFYVFIYYQNYTYDDLNRLTGASGMVTEGKSNAGNVFDSYVMQMDYNQMSSPVHYDLTFVNTGGSRNTNYDYLYDDKIQPNAPIKVGDMRYTYDASGNPISIDGSTVGRAMSYDAENRLREITDYRKNIMSQYSYKHTGERAVKRYGAFETMAVNGAPAGSKLDGNAKYSAYVSPYYVEHGSGTKPGAVSKHYYAGAVKIASKTADSAYFYFADHLGSTTHLTDRGGKVVQYAAYTPYGSLFREYRSVQPYKFNGKELDQETGYYYYGARYYDPSTALWLGTDPLKHKYPDIGAYVYCVGNPVKYVDPDGREPWENKNVRKARSICESLGKGYSVELTNGKYGHDASVVYTSSEGIKTQVNYYPATQQNHKSAVVNVVEYLDEGGRADPANNGTTTTADVRAVAGYCENLSDACDIAGTAFLMTGVGAEAGGVLYVVGTVSGGIGDVVNIGLDIYEGKHRNVMLKVLNGVASYFFGSKLNDGKSGDFMRKALDKTTDTITNKMIEE